MTDSLFREGGSLNARRTGKNKYEFKISIPTDERGMVGRECTNKECSPGYFKVKIGTGITEDQLLAYCPYCRTSEEPSAFLTSSQKDYAIGLVQNAAVDGMNREIQKAFGVNSSGKRRISGGPISLDISVQPIQPQRISRVVEEELQRDVICPYCGLEQAVFGLAFWCADCGEDIFLIHVVKELDVVRKMLSVVNQRNAELGARVASRDIENALEDLVSIFEAVLKIITKRHLLIAGLADSDITEILVKKVGNRYQNLDIGATIFKTQIGFNPIETLSDEKIGFLKSAFEKRHPITHNLGVVDRKYLERVRAGDLVGREIRIDPDDILKASEISYEVLEYAYKKITAMS